MAEQLAKSFLKWAGGKSKLLPFIRQEFPIDAVRYLEPFVGSGVVLFNAFFEQRVGCDVNADLIDTFVFLRDMPAEVIELTRNLFYDGNCSERFYELREHFNSLSPSVERSAIFIYLNRHCFNGLCRYNSSGKFNVPFGKYKTTYFPEKEMNNVAGNLKGVELINGDGLVLLDTATLGDVVYCDPPYVPLTVSANFTSYTSGSFGHNEQVKLARLAEEASGRGATVVISNHDTPVTRDLYQKAEIRELSVQRNISAGKREKVKELIAVFKGKH